MYKKSFHVDLKQTTQRISRRDYINFLPSIDKGYINSSKHFITPEREIIIMDSLYQASTRASISKDFDNIQSIHNFLKSFKQVPDNLNVYVWSTLTYGPVYFLNLKWIINNFGSFYNAYNKFDIVVISENGKLGFMATKLINQAADSTQNPTETHRFKKWGLI